MVRKFKLANRSHIFRKTFHHSRENANWLLHVTIIWDQETEWCTISKTRLQFYWAFSIYKLVQAIVFSTIAIHGPFNAANTLPKISSAIFCIAIATLIVTTLLDILLIMFAADVVDCFGWAFQISQDFCSNAKFGKLNQFYSFRNFGSQIFNPCFEIIRPTVFFESDGVIF